MSTSNKRPIPWGALGPWIALAVTCLFFTVQTERFLSGTNLSLVLQQVMVVGVLAIGQSLIILTAGIDLSCGMVMALSGVVMTKFAIDFGMNPYLATACGLGVAVGFGLLNGLLVTRMKLPPFIVTLGTLNIAFAVTQIYSESQTITDLPEAMTTLGNTFNIGSTEVSLGTVTMLLLYLLAWFVLRETSPGRHLYAVGNNPEAARLTGISVDRVLITVYAMAGLFYGIAAMLSVARTGVGDPNAGQTENLDAITAVVLGGTSLFGGRGLILGSLVGAVIVGVFRNGLTLMGVASVYQTLITGILVILAVAADQMSRKGAR
ncbi:MAG: ABC transporter permease [Comamonadaceae bacterium CG1_02_60_18]|nr:MAG: ABC transporter permease [Comamonadaceae bacterium CG1_02_60_18]PIQ50942.1 MAG: ABC transporter permease [Comamonadaceae bacterium CG12_big_fil_rev_8_21_14_0_65_59_15]